MSKEPKKAVPGFLAPAPQQYPSPPVPFYPPQPSVPQSLEVHIGVMTDPDATVATATLSAGGYGPAIVVKTGSSKRAPGDKHDAETATELAVGRALIRLGKELEKQANGKVKSADANRRHRASRTMKKATPTRIPDLGAAFIEEREGLEIVAHLLPGLSPDEVPQEVKDTLARLFPKANLRFAEFDATEMMAAFADLLGEQPQGRHSKDPDTPEAAS